MRKKDSCYTWHVHSAEQIYNKKVPFCQCQVCIALSCFCDMVLFFLLPDVLVFGLGKRGSCLNGFAARGATHSIDTCSEGVLRDCEVVVRA